MVPGRRASASPAWTADGLPVVAADIEAAAAAIEGRILRTPTALSRTLSEITGATVVVKFENFQFTASYKERGALNRLLRLSPDERRRGVVVASAGNFAQAVAYHAGLEGVPATIFMPVTTPATKVTRTSAFGAEVRLVGADFDEAVAHAVKLADDEGQVYLSPYDDAMVIAGQGTVALELLDDAPDLDALVVPVGGGGLLGGMAVACRARCPGIELVGVQAESHAAMVAALYGRSTTTNRVTATTIADGIAVKQPGLLTRRLLHELVDDVVTVSEPRIEEAVCLYLEVEKVVAEGAAAAGLAALLEHPDRFRGRRVGLVLTGGNIDLRLLASVVTRGLMRSGRLATVRIEVPDMPGALAGLTRAIGEHGANIVEVSHRRTLLAVPSRAVVVEAVLETKGPEELDAVVAALTADGHTVTVLPE